MSEYKPPFHMTDKITNLVAAISEQIGRIKALSHGNLNPHLRKENRIRTIHSSLAIANAKRNAEMILKGQGENVESKDRTQTK